MLGQYPPTLTQILLFALWFESVTYSQMDRISFIEIKEKSQESVRLERLGNFSQSWQRSQNTSRESETPLPVFFSFQVLWEKIPGRSCASCYLRSPSEEMKHFSILCFQCTKQLKIFVLENSCRSWNDLEIFSLCAYTYYMFKCSTVWSWFINIMALRSQSWVRRKLTPISHAAEFHATKRAGNIYLGILEHKWDIVVLSPWRCNCF